MAAKAHSTAPCAIPQTGKYTCYNRETMDHDCYYDGQYLGSRETAQQARELVDEHVYDMERSGLIYTAHQLDHGSSIEEIAADAPIADPIAALRAQIAAAEDYETKRRLIFRLFDTIIATDTASLSAEPDTLAGYLPDGTPIHGEYLIGVEPRERWGVVSADFPGWRITMDHDGYFTIANDAGDGETLCDEWHMRDLPARRAAVSHMLLSDTLERLYAAAVAWERSDRPQLPTPAASAIRVERLICDDRADSARLGTEIGVDYSCGDGLTEVLIGTGMSDRPGVDLIIGGAGLNTRTDQVITLDDVRQIRDNLSVLLADPRVLAACTEDETRMTKKQAA